MKNTRKLIPAIAMLLVSAVMLSTATFAWFTATDTVTASGMQIEAQASGSLLISNAPLTADDGKSEVVVNSATHSLVPAAFGSADGKGTLVNATAGWYVPDTANGAAINTTTGIVESGAYVAAADTSFYDETFYLACAGDPKTSYDLTITLTSPVHPANGQTHKAFSAAIYTYDENTADNTWSDLVPNAPAAILHVGEADGNDTRHQVVLEGVKIPSVDGATGTNTVGLKVVVRFYVDGALPAMEWDAGKQAMVEKNVTVDVINYVKPTGTAYVADTTYYTFAATTATVTPGTTDVTGMFTEVTGGGYTAATGKAVSGVTYYERTQVVIDSANVPTTVDATWYVATNATASVEYNYVRSADVPVSGSALKLAFNAVEHVAAAPQG